jgi:hypothetical protein
MTGCTVNRPQRRCMLRAGRRGAAEPTWAGPLADLRMWAVAPSRRGLMDASLPGSNLFDQQGPDLTRRAHCTFFSCSRAH